MVFRATSPICSFVFLAAVVATCSIGSANANRFNLIPFAPASSEAAATPAAEATNPFETEDDRLLQVKKKDCLRTEGKKYGKKKKKCVNICKKKKGEVFDIKKGKCTSICGNKFVFDKESKSCVCAGANTVFKENRGRCKCAKGFVKDLDGGIDCVPEAGSPTSTPTSSPTAVELVEVMVTQPDVAIPLEGSFTEEIPEEQAEVIGDSLCEQMVGEDSTVEECEAEFVSQELVEVTGRRNLQGGPVFVLIIIYNIIIVVVYVAPVIKNEDDEIVAVITPPVPVVTIIEESLSTPEQRQQFTETTNENLEEEGFEETIADVGEPEAPEEELSFTV